MSIVNSIATFTGVGAQLAQVVNTVVTTAGSPQTIRIPAGAVNFSPAVVRGFLRTKVYNQTVAASLTVIRWQAGDGTNLVDVAEFGPAAGIAISATAWVDVVDDFLLDTLPSASAGGAAGALINFGATFINCIITVTGGGGSLSADCEVAAEP
jgi:hypothetical protein